MKKTKYILLSLILATTTQVLAGGVLSVKQISNKLLSISVLTRSYCTSPLASLDYNFSGRASFGPHFYKLNLISRFRCICSREDVFEAVVEIPENLKNGDVLVVQGENNTSVEIEIQRNNNFELNKAVEIKNNELLCQ